MAFLSYPADYKALIKDEIMQIITEGDASNRTTAEAQALGQIKSRLSVRYDMNAAFNAVGAARNDEVIMIMVDLVIYHLHCRINPGQVPDLRSQRYNDALEWLKLVAGGTYDPGLPKVGDSDGNTTDDRSSVQWGGGDARNPYY